MHRTLTDERMHVCASLLPHRPLHCAAHVGREDIVRFMLERGILSNSVDNEGRRASMLAMMAGHGKVAALLMKHEIEQHPAVVAAKATREAAGMVRIQYYEKPSFYRSRSQLWLSHGV